MGHTVHFLLNVYPNKVPPILSHRPDSISKFSLSFDVHFHVPNSKLVCNGREEKLFYMTCPVQGDAFNILNEKNMGVVAIRCGIFQIFVVLLNLLEGLHIYVTNCNVLVARCNLSNKMTFFNIDLCLQ